VPEKLAEHVEPPEPQFIPAGLDVIFPFVGFGLIDIPAFKSADNLTTKASVALSVLFCCAPPEVPGKSIELVFPTT
jgi:hypothetical protein